jgi:hypothetical protein
MPLAAHVSISTGRMGRDALLMSVSPRQNRSKPPPVPDTPTVTRRPGLAIWNSSATASLIGKTVLDPSIRISAGVSASPSPPLPPQATTAIAITAQAATRPRQRRTVCIMFSTLATRHFAAVTLTLIQCYRPIRTGPRRRRAGATATARCRRRTCRAAGSREA